MVAGKYGTTPMPIDPAFRKKIIGDMEPVDCRPADLLEPELEKLRAEIPEWIEQEEDVLSYGMFQKVALDFFEKRRNEKLESRISDFGNRPVVDGILYQTGVGFICRKESYCYSERFGRNGSSGQ